MLAAVLLVAAIAGWAVVLLLLVRRREPAERLRRAERLLGRREETDAARLRFFANVAHELRTPLTLILGELDAALDEPDAEARAHQLRVAGRQARRLERLADQALDLTRLDAGSLEARPVDLEVVPYLESLVMSFGELAERTGIRLEFIARPRSIGSTIDPEHLATIVTNLLSNAFKYTATGGRVGVAVEERADSASTAGGSLTITVADTGTGIPEDQQQRIFEPFVRGAQQDGDDPGGAGIGLALANELCRLAGGRITVESRPGRGSRFVVHLPLDRAVPRRDAPALVTGSDRPAITAEMLYRTTDADGTETDAPTEERPTLLVVEDHADMRDWLADQLREIGSVVQAADGVDGLAQARALVPDLIVTDVRMPGLDGLELCRRLRADERTSHIPIVIASVLDSVDRRLEGIEAGADEYLGKPLDARELRARVGALMALRQSLRERFRTQVIVRPSDVSTRPVDQIFFDNVMTTIEARLGDREFSVPQLADQMAMSTSQLTRKLRALIQQSPGQLIRATRMQRAADLIRGGAGNIAQIAYQLGFADQAHFTRSFKQHIGKTPMEYRRDAQAAAEAP